MFGAICAGRPVQTNLQQVDQTKFVFQLPNAESINHITVFLLPETPFPDGYGATVFFSWPGKDFQLLGGLSNAKPSAIFKLRGHELAVGAQGIVASLGISIEPLQAVETQVATLKSSAASAGSFTSGAMTTAPPSASTLTTRIVANLYGNNDLMNYFAILMRQLQLFDGICRECQSNFTDGTICTAAGMANRYLIVHSSSPWQAFQEWHTKFTKRIQLDASFLERDQD